MYEPFFGLKDKPFSLTSNTRFVFASAEYREVESQLTYGITHGEGLMLLTGQPGTGKTTLCRDIIERFDRERVPTAFIFSPFLTASEMLAALLTEFGVNAPPEGSAHELLERLRQFLLAQLALRKVCVAIFDEAQHLSDEALEQIRALTNLETNEQKLIQVVLVGQPALLERLRTPRLAKLEQRVAIRCSLSELDESETARYVLHRLDVAGAADQIHIEPRALKEIYRASRGLPRLINLIADRALLAAFAAQTHEVSVLQAQKAVAALRGEDTKVHAAVSGSGRWRRRAFALAGIAIIAVSLAGVSLWTRRDNTSPEDRLYWSAVAAPTAADAERDLRAFTTRYPTSNRMRDVLLRLAQLELSRGERDAAVDHLGQLARLVPSGIEHARAIVLGAVARLDGGDTAVACQNLSPDLASAAAADTALSRRLTVLSSTCAAQPSIAGAHQ